MWILDFLVRLPEPVAYLLLVAIGIGVGQALIWAVDRAIPRRRRERVNELLGMLLAVVGFASALVVPLALGFAGSADRRCIWPLGRRSRR